MSTPLTSRKRSHEFVAKSDHKSHISHRRSLTGLSPGMGGESPQLPDVRNEADARERREKRKSRNFSQVVNSPLVRPDVENLGETAKLTNDQLATHYVNCIKLSAENKITAKNAFNLHLIDHMNEMLKQRCEGTLNFQMAGGTIFASAKIYASRVDAVHSEAYKVLSSLGRGISEEDGKNVDGDESGQGSEEFKDVGKKKKKRSKILESNSNALRLKKVDVCWQTDPLDQYYSSKFDTSCTSGLLINNLQSCSDGITLRFDSDMESPLTRCVFGNQSQTDTDDDSQETEGEEAKEEEEPQLAEMDTALGDVLNVVKNEKMKNSEICQTVNAFSWEKDESFEWAQEKTDDFETDRVATIASVPEQDDLFMDDEFPHDGIHSDGSDSANEEVPDTPSSFPVGMDAELITSFMPGEYSYFKPGAFSTWEGPNHWKMKFRPNANAGSENDAEKGPERRAAKGKKRKRTYQIDYKNTVVNEKEFENVRKSTTVSKRIREKWLKTEEDRMLPSLGEHNVLDLAKCVLQPCVQIRPVTLIHGSKKDLPTTQVDPDNIASYNYNNPHDKNNYCPIQTDDDVGDPGGAEDESDPLPSDFANCDYNGLDNVEGFPDMTMSQTQNMSQLTNYHLDVEAMLQGDHLVSHPKKVEKISIAYAKKATRIDVRRLKAAMWTLLHKNDELLVEPPTPPVEVPVADISDHQSTSSDDQKTFSNMYSTLPRLVPTTMAENLSVPLAFTCLLHLANEKSLKIEAMPDMSDLNITEPMNE